MVQALTHDRFIRSLRVYAGDDSVRTLRFVSKIRYPLSTRLLHALGVYQCPSPARGTPHSSELAVPLLSVQPRSLWPITAHEDLTKPAAKACSAHKISPSVAAPIRRHSCVV